MARQGYPIDPEYGDTYDFTAPEFQDTRKRMAYQGFPSGAVNEMGAQRQRWQARLLRENPDDMGLYANQQRALLEEEGGGGGGDTTKTPAERDAEFEELLDLYFRK